MPQNSQSQPGPDLINGPHVALVGAGPGDPGLITVRGAELLAQAQVVLYDDLVGSGLVDRIPADAVKIYVGKRAGRAALGQAEIQEEMLRWARRGHRVVRLKGGDPLVFGRGLEELQGCAQEAIPAELVPGISSALAAPAYAGFAPTLRGVSSAFTVVTGHEDPSKGSSDLDWAALARTPGTLIILMGMGRLRQIVAELLLGGRSADTPAAVIQWGTTRLQREVLSPLSRLPGAVEQQGVSSPAVIIIGDVAAGVNRVEWLRRARPLWGVRVLDTRQGSMSAEFRKLAEGQGAEVINCPVVTTEPVQGPEGSSGSKAEDDLLGMEGGWIVWSSAVGVRMWAQRLKQHGWDGRWLAGRKLACVGPGTAQALEAAGFHADLVAQPSRQEGLASGLLERETGAASALLVGARQSDPHLERALVSRGWVVRKVSLYETRELPEGSLRAAGLIAQREVDWVVVSSGSAVDSLAHAWGTGPDGNDLEGKGRFGGGVGWISIGPVTSERIRKHGGDVAAEAVEPTASGLYGALLRAVQSVPS